jgi:hypothetical protein
MADHDESPSAATSSPLFMNPFLDTDMDYLRERVTDLEATVSQQWWVMLLMVLAWLIVEVVYGFTH